MFWDRHFPVLEAALAALHKREFWTPYPEIPSGKIYGETAKQDGLIAYEDLLNKAFILADHPESTRSGAEISPYGTALGITYPAATVEQLTDAANAAADAFAKTDAKARTGALLEVLARLNRDSFLMGNAVMHTTGQAFAHGFSGRWPTCAGSRPGSGGNGMGRDEPLSGSCHLGKTTGQKSGIAD